MTINWLGTTAIALVIGASAVSAQSPEKREEGPRAQTPSTPSKDADRPAAKEQRPTDRLKDGAAQREPNAGAKEQRRGESASPPERRQAQESPQQRDTKQPARQSQEQPSRREPEPKAGATEPRRGEAASPPDRRQAQEPPQQRDTKQPAKQSQEQPSRGERPAASPTQQSQDHQKGRDARQPAEPKQQQGRDEQPKQDNRALDAKTPADSKQQQGQQQPGRDRNDQAAQPSATPPTQQGARPGDTGQDRQRDQNTGQASDQSTRRGGTSSVAANDEQRRQIVERLRRERAESNQNINIHVDVGQRLPPNVQPRPLPPDIVRIAPQYRDYEYTVVEDEIVFVDPRSREIIDVVREPGSPVETGSRVERERVVITGEQRERLRQTARRMTTGSSSTSGSVPDSSCLTLQPVPEDLVRTNPELGSYRYLAIGDQVVIVDPRQQKIVQVID